MQHPNFQEIVGKFLLEEQFTDILEVGTAFGGFIRFVKDTLPNARVATYDLFVDNSSLKDFDIEFRFRSPFSEDYRFIDCDLVEFISSSKRLLVIVDGGDKIKEFRLISPLLREGDHMMCHDYVYDDETFKRDYENKIWNWHEVREQDISESCVRYNLVTVHPELNSVVWQCKKKMPG